MKQNSNEVDLKKFCTFRLPTWKSKEAQKYADWCYSHRREGWEWHHLLKRQYGHLLLVHIPSDVHKKIHNLGYSENQFETLFVEAIQNLINYIESKK